MKKQLPEGLPKYRLLTGVDNSAFCHRISEALELGYELYKGPAITYNSDQKTAIVAQALIWKEDES